MTFEVGENRKSSFGETESRTTSGSVRETLLLVHGSLRLSTLSHTRVIRIFSDIPTSTVPRRHPPHGTPKTRLSLSTRSLRDDSVSVNGRRHDGLSGVGSRLDEEDVGVDLPDEVLFTTKGSISSTSIIVSKRWKIYAMVVKGSRTFSFRKNIQTTILSTG